MRGNKTKGETERLISGCEGGGALSLDSDELKRKLRQLKRLEGEIRFGSSPRSGVDRYVWSRYFSTKKEESSVLYPFETLVKMDRESIKEVFAEYFSMVYYIYYKENGILPPGLYDPELLQKLGLPPDSTGADIKKRFRELVKKHHPDHGGDSGDFIELMEIYRKLSD